MWIESEGKHKTVDDYDFLFANGFMLPITIDKEAGDHIVYGKEIITIRITGRPSLADPKQFLPTEEVTLFVPHLLSIQHREREVVEMTDEERSNLFKSLSPGNQTVN